MIIMGVQCVSHRHELESEIQFSFAREMNKKLRGHGIESVK